MNTMEFSTLEAADQWLFYNNNRAMFPETLKRIIVINFYQGSDGRGVIHYANN